MRNLKKLIPALVLIVLCTGFASASVPSVTAETAVLIDADTGQILYDKNMHQQMYPASITKVITTITGIENIPLDEVLTMSHYAVFSLPVGSSHIALDEGEEITMEQALYAAILMSANDACNGIAETAGRVPEGSEASIANFTTMMNETAKRAGALNSNFINAHGISEEGHLTTAYDMAMICRYALKNETFRKVFGTYKYIMPPNNKKNESRTFVSQHYMISQPEYQYDGVIGGKTGWTNKSKHTLVTAAERDGRTLVAVVMKCPGNDDKYNDTAALFDYGFGDFDAVIIEGKDLPEKAGYTLNEPMTLLVEKGTKKENIIFEFSETDEKVMCTAIYPNGKEITSFPCEKIPEPEPQKASATKEEKDEEKILIKGLITFVQFIFIVFLVVVGGFMLLVLGLYIRKRIYRARKKQYRRRRR